MTVGDKDAVKALKPDACLEDLALGAFTTIDQEAAFIM